MNNYERPQVQSEVTSTNSGGTDIATNGGTVVTNGGSVVSASDSSGGTDATGTQARWLPLLVAGALAMSV